MSNSTEEYRIDCGTIKKVDIVNFMCHEHLEVNFDKKITFITGPNGSGKSAILTALQVARWTLRVTCRWLSVSARTAPAERTRSTSLFAKAAVRARKSECGYATWA